MFRIALSLIVLVTPASLEIVQAPSASASDDASPPEKLAAEHLPNAYRVHARVISGGLPEGDAAFRELQALGVQTVISVDGAQPDVQTAAKFGLRYVHLPHGYDGVPQDRAAALTKAVRDLPGPVYIHCHHGKHRSPAAAVVACVSAGLMEPESALIVLKTAGTSENYRGLYESAQAARRIDDQTLDALDVEFPESAKLPAIAEAMIPIEHAHDHLKLFAANNWQALAEKPDLEAAHEALLLREHFTELLRLREVEQQTEEFRKLTRASEAAAKELEAHVRADRATPATKSLELATQNCATCHRKFRDVPLSEKQGAAR